MRSDTTVRGSQFTGVDIRRNRSDRAAGLAYGLAAYLWFSGSVFWFKSVEHVPALEVLAHRTLGAAVLLTCLLVVTDRWRVAINALRNRATLFPLTATALLIGCSWYTYIWAIAHDRVLDTSLAYYISPLMKVLIGCVLLSERLSLAQAVSAFLAFVGIVILGISYGQLPVISLGLAFISGCYGFLRKKVSVDAATGLAIESLILTPVALTFVIYLAYREQLVFGQYARSTDVLLLLAGFITAIPMVWYCKALKRLPYSTVGLMMYIMPSLTFLIAVFVFEEPFGTAQLLTFCCVWLSLLIFAYDAVRRRNGSRLPQGACAEDSYYDKNKTLRDC